MMLSKIIKFLFKTEQDKINEYLASSENLVELERRQKKLQQKGIWI